jgi:hypothetical protein
MEQVTRVTRNFYLRRVQMLNRKLYCWLFLSIITAAGFIPNTNELAAQNTDRPWMNKSLTPAERAEMVLKEMRLDENYSKSLDDTSSVQGGSTAGAGVVLQTAGNQGAIAEQLEIEDGLGVREHRPQNNALAASITGTPMAHVYRTAPPTACA